MSRYKTFDATGIAPNGVLYSGDLNAIQDRFADLSNFAQTIDAAAVRLGDTSIQLLKYGTAEARLSAAMRTDGILRGLGGLYAGQFTTAGRPGAGNRPYGLVIFNTDISRYEVNVGTDAAPSWLPILFSADVVQLPIGGSFEYAGNADIAANLVLEDGREVSRTGLTASLFALLSTSYGSGNGTTTFNIPDSRGSVAVGPDNMGTARGARNLIPNSNRALGQSGGEERHVMTIAELAAHTHQGTGSPTGGITQDDTPDHGHSGSTGDDNVDHTHTVGNHTHTMQVEYKASFAANSSSIVITDINNTSGASPGTQNFAVSGGSSPGTTGRSNVHQHSVSVGGANARHHHGINSDGSNSPHNTMQPYVVKNKIIRIY